MDERYELSDEERAEIRAMTEDNITFYWGDRCYEPCCGCSACAAWAVWDKAQPEVDTVSTKPEQKLVTRLDQMEEIDWVMFRAVAQMVQHITRTKDLTEEQDRILKWMDAHYDRGLQGEVINILTDEVIEEEIKCKLY